MTTVRRYVNYGPLALELIVQKELAEHVERELSPFFEFADETVHEVIASLHMPQKSERLAKRPECRPRNLDVDTSLYKHLASEGLRWDISPDIYIVEIVATGTRVLFDKVERRIDLFNPDTEPCRIDFVRLVKGLFTPALECAGCVQLHSAGVVDRDGAATLLLGDMWMGKTTVLLQMLSEFDVGQLSCDTVVAWNDGVSLVARGWPTPFSISNGTLSDQPELYEHFPKERANLPYSERWIRREKTVLTSKQVVEYYGTFLSDKSHPVDAIIVARYLPDEPTGIELIEDYEGLMTLLRPIYLGSRDPIYHNWHEFVVCSDSEIDSNLEVFAKSMLEKTDVYVMTWAPSMTSLLKRIPKFARQHKAMRDIVDY